MTQIKDMNRNNMVIEETLVLVKALEIKQTRHNKNYLQLQIQDKTGSIKAMIWDIDSNNKAQKIKESDALVIHKGTVSIYRDVASIVINEFDMEPDADMDQLVPSAPQSEEELRTQIQHAVDSIQNKDLNWIVNDALEENDQFYTHPAATFMHHDFKGGLAYHTLCMLNAAAYYSRIYPFLNYDLLIAGIILHDVGKTVEINGYIDSSKTFQGELLGHINIILDQITRIMINEGIKEQPIITELKHIIISHHGELEYGSNMTPKTPEAQIIHYIDQIDAKMMMFQQALDNEEAQFTNKVFGLHNNRIYNRRFDNPE